MKIMKKFGTSVKLNFSLNKTTKLINYISVDNRKLNIQEHVSVIRKNKKLVLHPQKTIEKLEEKTLIQTFQTDNSIITRKFSIIEEFEDRKGSGFEINVTVDGIRDFDLEWGLVFKNPDYVFGDDESSSSIQIFLKKGDFTINSKNAKYLRIDEIDGYTILLPLELEEIHDNYKYNFYKDTGLRCVYGRNHESDENTIRIFGYLSISRKDEPISDNSLILIDKGDWKSMIKAVTYPTEITNRNKNIRNFFVFHKRNVFPMVFTEADPYESIQEFLILGQALNIVCTKEISEKNKHLKKEPFLKSNRIDPRFRWKLENQKFRFAILLPDDPLLCSSLVLLIRSFNIFPIFVEDLNPTKIKEYKEILLEDNILILDDSIENSKVELLNENGFNTSRINMGRIEKASLRIAKAYFLMYILDSAIFYTKVFGQPNSPKGILETGEKVSIVDIIDKEINSLNKNILDLLENQSFSNLLKNVLSNNFYDEIVELEKKIIGLDSLIHKSSLSIEENKNITRLRRLNIVSTKIENEDVVSLILYSLAYDSQTIFIDEEKLPNISKNSIDRIFKAIKTNKSFKNDFESIEKQIENSVLLNFIQKWSDYNYNLEYSAEIMEMLNFPLPYPKNNIKNRVESSKGIVSIFLLKEIPIEILLGKYLESNFSFGRFFLNDSKLLRHQIRSSLMHPRRGNNLILRSEIITVEASEYLLKKNKILEDILKCHGEAEYFAGSINHNSLDSKFKQNDLIFLFIHGEDDLMYPNLMDTSIVFDKNTVKEKRYYRGILVLNSCETGQDFTGSREGIPVTLSKFGFPLVIAPYHKVTFKTAVRFSQLLSSILYDRTPISQLVSLCKRLESKKNNITTSGFFVFGNPYTRLFNPKNMKNEETNNCIRKALMKK